MFRVEVQGTIARHFLLPGLVAFLERYPEIEISMSESDRWADVVREGVDCVLRYGALRDSDLIARPVTTLERITCAAPAYLERYGYPQTPDDLKNHRAVGIRLISTGALTPIEFVRAGGVSQVDMPTPFSATGTETFRSAVLLGLGRAQMPVFHIDRDLAEGRLVRIPANYATPSAPVSILHPRSRQLSPRVRLFIDWMVQRFSGTRDLS
jgi:DNA-binding transcriptional LysR family regulator